MANELEEGQIVFCTVDKIIGTTVFVKIEGNGEGTITTSEISPGRIRNLRDYVVLGKKIVCKILKIQGDKIHLSLRRVKQNEKKELLEKISKEKSYKAIFNTVLKENAMHIINKIMNDYSLIDFFEEVKTNPKLLDKYLNKEESEKIKKILESKKDKAKEIKKYFKLSSNSSDGMTRIKNILKDSCKDSKCQISYISAGKYQLKIKGDDFKKIKSEVNQVMDNIEKQAKKNKYFFELEKS